MLLILLIAIATLLRAIGLVCFDNQIQKIFIAVIMLGHLVVIRTKTKRDDNWLGKIAAIENVNDLLPIVGETTL